MVDSGRAHLPLYGKLRSLSLQPTAVTKPALIDLDELEAEWRALKSSKDISEDIDRSKPSSWAIAQMPCLPET